MAIKIGDRLPEATFRVISTDGIKTLTTGEVFGGKSVVLFAVPGAFTPTCHLKHLPGFIESAGDFKKQGIDTVACVAVNDPFVLGAWEEASGGKGKVLFLSDGNARRSAWISTAAASVSAPAPSATPRSSTTAWSRC
jgi:glutaredoxin/glutathione-dependent peroxiredoxin